MKRYFPDLVAICAVAVFASVLFSINYSWMFLNIETLGSIDPFIYRGYFMNLAAHLKTFDGTYYTSRLPHLLIGAASQQLPDTIGVVLMRSLYALAAAVGVYAAVSRLTGNRVAGLTAVILLLTDTYVLVAAGSDYVSGAAFTFLSVGAGALVAASVASGRRKWLCLLVAGAALGTAVATHILSLMPAAFLGLLYLLLSKDRLGFVGLLGLCLTVAIGAAVAVGTLGLVSLSFGGKFLFFLPQFVSGPGIAAQWMPINRPAGLGFMLDWAWNWPHFLVATLSIFVLGVWRAPKEAWASRARAALIIQSAYMVLLLVLELLGLGILRVSFNYVYPEVFTIIAIGALIGIALHDESPRNQLIVLAVMAFLSVAFWLSFRLTYVPCACAAPVQRYGHEIAIAALVLAAAVALTRSGWQRVIGISAAAATWIVLGMALSNSAFFDPRGGAEGRRSFVGFLAFSRDVNRFAPPEAKYWFDAYSKPVLSDVHRTGMARVFMAQAATWLYGVHIASDAFPSLKHPFSGKPDIQDGDTIVALSLECSPPELAAQALDAAGFTITARTSRAFDFNGTSVCGDRMKIARKPAS
jgi:hypothetical protein